MTAKLEFNLEEPEDVLKFNRCNKSLDLTLCLFNLKERMYKDRCLTPDEFFEIFNSYNIHLEELIL